MRPLSRAKALPKATLEAKAPEEVWYAEGMRFTCSRCGRCCQGPEPGFVAVEQHEIERLAAFLEISLERFGAKYLRRLPDGRVSLTERRNGDCIFWQDQEGCAVYRARPDQCRTFPFWPETLENQEGWDDYAAMCPGMGTGRRYSLARIQRLLRDQVATYSSRRHPPG